MKPRSTLPFLRDDYHRCELLDVRERMVATFSHREDCEYVEHVLTVHAPLVVAAQRALEFFEANYKDADMPDILPQLRAAVLAVRE